MQTIFLLFFSNILIQINGDEIALSNTPVIKEEYITAEFLTGKNNYYTDTNFIEIPEHMAYRKQMFLLKETYSAYNKMYLAAKKDGINLKIISASRTFVEQSWIWEDKWKTNKSKFATDNALSSYIMQYSAMPGTSRHHWGTEVDLNSTSASYFASGTGLKVYNWLVKNAATYGFCQSYNAKGTERDTGYNEEMWHWSYFSLANRFLEGHKKKVDYTHITGFSGDFTAKSLEVIDNYVLAINNNCSN